MAVYKYLRPGLLMVLANASIRATQASALNDPFELNPYFDVVMDEDDLEAQLADSAFMAEALAGAYPSLPEHVRAEISAEQFAAVLSSAELRPQLEKFIRSQAKAQLAELSIPLASQLRTRLHEDLGAMVGIVSFSEDPLNTLMWTHYGEDHRGFVIEFDDTHPFFDRRRSPKDEFFHLRQVKYADPSPGLIKMLDVDPEILCIKRQVWSYERERRLLIPLVPGARPEEIRLIEFPRSSVRRVLLGARSSPELATAVEAALSAHEDYRDVAVLKVGIDSRSAKLVL